MEQKLRVAILTRVSTKMEVQDSSLLYQNDTLIDYVKRQKNFIFDESKDVYSDRVSGTKIHKNNQNDQGYDVLMERLNISISDINSKDFAKVSIEIDKTKKPLYDLIVCKSTSRFSRAGFKGGTLIEIMKNSNINVFFYDLNKDLFSMSDLELSIFSMSDNQYSKTMSSNTRLNKIYKAKNKELMLHGERFGWDLVKIDGHRYFKQNDEEKEVLDLIIKMLLVDDLGCNTISQRLEKKGIKSHKLKFDPSNIQRILKDLHYCGMEKYYQYPEDYKFQFQVDRDYLKNLNFSWEVCPYIDVLIPKETYDEIQAKLQSRTSQGRGVKQRRKVLSKKLVCGHCGNHYYSLGSYNYYSEQAYQCSSKRSVQQKKKVPCVSERFYINFFNEWATKQANELPNTLYKMCKDGIVHLLNLEHHLALVLDKNNFEDFEKWNEKREQLKQEYEEKVMFFLENAATSETREIMLKFQAKMDKDINALTKKINVYLGLQEEIITTIKEIRKLESALSDLQKSIKKSYTLEEFIDECQSIFVYKKPSEKRHKNRVMFIYQLKLENEIFKLLDGVMNSTIIEFLPKKTIYKSNLMNHNKYLVSKVSEKDLDKSIAILEGLDI